MTQVIEKAKQVPGPGGHFLLGNLPDYKDDPLDFLLNLAQEYGDISHFRFMGTSAILLNHPDYIKHVLQDNNRNYNKDTVDYDMLRPVVGNGLLTNDGEDWLRQRRLIQPAFHRRQIDRFGRLMVQAADEMLAAWNGRSQPNDPVDIAQAMMRLTLRIVGEALFGIDLSGEANEVGAAFTYINEDLSSRLIDGYFIPLPIPTPRNLRFHEAKSKLDHVVAEIIQERRREKEERDDLLALLLNARDEETGTGMDDEQMHDELITLLLAGHETTAVALSWTFYLLSEHPKVRQKLEAEVDQVLNGRLPTIDDLPELTYTHQVLQESMRLYPPAWAISRKAIEADTIDDYYIPQGAMIVLSPYTMHRHPRYWTNPEGFDPERFRPEAAKDRPHFAYFPFGGGPRLCIGADFAMTEAQLVLTAVTQRYRLNLVPGHPVKPSPLITLRPKEGLQMTLHQRSAN